MSIGLLPNVKGVAARAGQVRYFIDVLALKKIAISEPCNKNLLLPHFLRKKK